MEHGWRLTRESWNALGQRLEGRRWRKALFRQRYRDTIPQSSGVYAICAPPPVHVREFVPKGLYEVLYVGLSTNLQNRFLQHLGRHPKEEIAQLSECYGPSEHLNFWFVAAEETEIKGLEAALIECFGPPGNLIGGIKATVGPPRPA